MNICAINKPLLGMSLIGLMTLVLCGQENSTKVARSKTQLEILAPSDHSPTLIMDEQERAVRNTLFDCNRSDNGCDCSTCASHPLPRNER